MLQLKVAVRVRVRSKVRADKKEEVLASLGFTLTKGRRKKLNIIRSLKICALEGTFHYFFWTGSL